MYDKHPLQRKDRRENPEPDKKHLEIVLLYSNNKQSENGI